MSLLIGGVVEVWGPSLSGVASGGGVAVCVCGIRRGGGMEFPVPVCSDGRGAKGPLSCPKVALSCSFIMKNVVKY